MQGCRYTPLPLVGGVCGPALHILILHRRFAPWRTSRIHTRRLWMLMHLKYCAFQSSQSHRKENDVMFGVI